MKKTLHIKVYGIVQGVGFRFFTKQKADALALKGTVQNLTDGTVLIQVTGDNSIVFEFLQWCHNGPPSAQVDKLEYEEVEAFDSDVFKIIRV